MVSPASEEVNGGTGAGGKLYREHCDESTPKTFGNEATAKWIVKL